MKQGHIKFLGFLFILWIIYFWKVFLLGQVFYLGDSQAFDLPLRVFFVNSLKNGELPLWNPYILSGIPFLLIGSQGLINPSTLLFFIFSPELAMTYATVINVFLSGVFMYFFVFLISRQKISAFFAGLIYMYSGLSANASMAIVINQELPLVPLVFITTRLFILQRKKIFLFLTAFLLALQFISGFPLIPYLTALGITIYYLFESKERFRQKIFSFFIIAIFAFGFSAFLLFPQIEATLLSTRPLLNYSYATSHSLHPLSLITFIFPHFYGVGEIEIGFNTHNRNYLGLIPLFIIVYVLFRKRNLIQKSILILTILGFFLALGRYFPLYRLFLLIPGLANFREPEFFILWYVFGGSIISGVGIDYLITNIKQVKFRSIFFSRYLKIILFIACLFFLSLILYLNFAHLPLIPKIGKLKNLMLVNLSNLLFSTLLVTTTIILIRKLSKSRLFVFLTVLIFADLYFLNQSEFFLMRKSDYQKIFTPNKIPTVIKKNKNISRIHSITYHEGPVWDNFSRESFIQGKIKIDANVLFPNRNMSYNIASVDGFSPLIIKSYADFLSENKNTLSGITSYDISNTNNQLAKAGARYILSNETLSEYKAPRYQLLETDHPNYFLYEDTQARNRAFLLDKEGKETGFVTIESSKTNSVVLKSESEVNASLILLDTYYPGWSAYVDGLKTQVKPFEKTFRQIDLKPGTHVVNFIFKPQSFFTGLKIACITIVLISIYGMSRLFMR